MHYGPFPLQLYFLEEDDKAFFFYTIKEKFNALKYDKLLSPQTCFFKKKIFLLTPCTASAPQCMHINCSGGN